jgi:hypothetical protein
LLQTTDPQLLALIGEQPLSPAGGNPVAPGTAAPGQPDQSLAPMSQVTENPTAQSTQVQGQAPNMPSMPIDPATGMPFDSGSM